MEERKDGVMERETHREGEDEEDRVGKERRRGVKRTG